MPKRIRRVAVLIDREQRVRGDAELVSERAQRHAPMEYHLARTLRAMDCEVALIPALSGGQIIRELKDFKPDVVYNATEHMYGRRSDDMHVPALLEMLRIPYTGASSVSLHLCRDKAVSKALAAMAGVRTPPFTLSVVGDRKPEGVPPFPVVVKPLTRDSSEGISLGCVARTARALEKRLRIVHERYREPAIIESFISGIDVYVFALHDRGFRILPPQTLVINSSGSSPRSMATFHVKHDDAYRARWGIHCRPADVSRETTREIERSIRRLWPVLQLRDYARFDYRLTPSGELYFIEANPNPGFQPNSRYDKWTDEEYAKAVRMLLAKAVARSSNGVH